MNIVNHQVRLIENEWQAVCDEAKLSEAERAMFWRREYLNPFAFEGWWIGTGMQKSEARKQPCFWRFWIASL